MKILLFGKDGMVGRAIVMLCEGQNLACEAHGRDTADFTRPDQCAAIVRASDADVIINCAAYTAVDKAEEERDLAQQVNCGTVAAIAQAAAAKDMPLVHISTDYVFSADHDQPIKASDSTNPINYYGASKLAGEKALRNFDLRYAIIRTSWVFSSSGNNFVKTMLRLAQDRKSLNIVADQIGGPTSAQSIARACLIVADQLHSRGHMGGIYQLSGQPDVSWADFARNIFRQANLDVEVGDIATQDYPTPAKRPQNSRMDCSGVKADFDIDRPDWKADLATVIKEMKRS